MSLKDFFKSKSFISNLGYALLIIVGIILVVLIWMNLYTRHGQAKSVPNFVGLTMEQTEKLARKSRLRYQIIDSIFTTAVPRGCIAEQNPKPGFKVKKWRTVVLTINAFHPEMVAMPNLVNLPKRQAILSIQNSGLDVGLLKYRPDLSIDVVISQEYNGRIINEGDSIQKGSVIDLVLGKGLSNQRTEVPDLIGLKLEQAKNKILASSLNLGSYVYDNTIVSRADTMNAFVYKQNPGFRTGATLQLGSAMYLWLSVDTLRHKVDSTHISVDTIPAVTSSETDTNQP